MSDEHYIAPIFIEKLAHKIPEVRERALFSIISKLDYGFTFEDELVSYRELLSKLFNWFLLEPCTNEDNVILLIKRILQLPKGKILMEHCKDALQLEIDKIKSYIHPKFYQQLDDIFNTETQAKTSKIDVVPEVVPPLSPLTRSSISDVQSSTAGATSDERRDGLVREGLYLYIDPTFIQDLEHKIPEIRENALFSIISRIDCGFTFENEVPCYRQLLTNLINWFVAEPCKYEEDVISLIKKILQSPTGKILMADYLPEMQRNIDRIQSYIDPKLYEKLNDTLHTEAFKINIVCQIPLSPEVPLSSRISICDSRSSTIGAAASTNESLIPPGTPIKHEMSFPPSSRQGSFQSENYPSICSSNLKYVLEWQPLIETDRIVLQTVEKSLKNPQEVSEVLHSCAFFINVLIRDFPAEVFIQRPGIVTQFYELISTCHSSRLNNKILQCLFELTMALETRIHQYNDTGMQHSNTEELFNLGSYDTNWGSSSDNGRSEHGRSDGRSEQFELPKETRKLKNKQFTIPEFCFRTINIILKCMALKRESLREHRPKFNHIGLTYCLKILDEQIFLLYETVSGDLKRELPSSDSLELYKEISNSSSLFGDTIEYFNLESISVRSNLTCRAVYLFLTCISAKWLVYLIPPSKSKVVLPKNFKKCLCNRLLDVSLGRLYPKIHSCLLEFVKSFSSGPDIDCLKKYEDVVKVCNGLTSSVKFIKDSDCLATTERFRLAYEALPSLEFHQNMAFIAGYVDLCSKNFFDYAGNYEVITMANDTILFLLAHRLLEIKMEMYRLCHKIVTKNIGSQINLSPKGIYGSQIAFLLNPAVLTEIAVFGLNNKQLQKYAEDILLYILKCKIIVSDLIWNKCIEALIPSLPLIICYSANSTSLGRTIVNFVDPDSVKAMGISYIVMLKANVELLFCKDSTLRAEAYSRISWLMSMQENAREMLPKFNTIYNETLSNACNIEKTMDANKIKRSVHFYQPSSLLQVLDVLKSENVDPSIRRSALNQISLMIEDYLLHETFLNLGGIDVMIPIMEIALTANDVRDIPDSIIPIVSVLKTMALYHSSFREYIGLRPDVIYYTLRGAFLFINDDRMRQDASVLLFLLVFKDYIIGSPISGDFSIPKIVGEKLLVPFFSKTHMHDSKHMNEDLFSQIVQDRYSLISLQVQWNAEIHGGFDNLMKLSDCPSLVAQNVQCHEILTLKNSDLQQIKSSSLDFCIKKYIFTIQSATTHEAVLDSIAKLTLYVHLATSLTQLDEEKCTEVVSHPWKKSFIRYLDFLPSGDEDIKILESVIKFLIVLLPLYEDSEPCWISKFLKNPKNPLLNLLAVDDFSEEDVKMLGQELLKLITLCVIRENNCLNSSASNIKLTSDWGHMMRIISKNLESDSSQNFQNLAYLDALLSCLVNLTGILGWSQCKPGNPPKEPIPQLILSLCQLLVWFHHSKGDSTTASFMGLTILRNVFLILNHLLTEMIHFKVKNWDRCFFHHDETRSARRSFFCMWSSRDVILRAAALQLFSRLTNSTKATSEILNDFEEYKANIWELAMRIITDYGEAGIVKENAALLLANLSKYISSKSRSGSMPSIFFLPSSDVTSRKETLKISKFLEECDFYNHIEIILTPVYPTDYLTRHVPLGDQDSLASFVSLIDEPQQVPINISTPGFIKTFCTFLFNIIDLAPNEICQVLQERGFVKLLFRLICTPMITISNQKELAFNCNLLEMDIAICTVLKKICLLNGASSVTLLHTRDCLNALFCLLDSKKYQTDLSSLVYLRNNLWSEIFNLITALLDGFDQQNFTSNSIDSLSIIAEMITETGTGIFLDTLCESLGSIGTNHLQNSSLTTLIALLRIECTIALNKDENYIPKTHSIENLLDTVRSHKTILIPSFNEDIELQKNRKNYKKDLLEETYFGKVTPQPRSKQRDEEIEISIIDSSDDDALMAGAGFCKILLYLFDIVNIKLPLDNMVTKRYLVNAALTGLLCISQEAKKLALQKGLMGTIVKELRDFHVQLSLESFDNLRKVQDKRRISPKLKEIGYLIALLTNFMLNAGDVKELAASLDLADVTHKLWVWFSYQNASMINVLKMISVYTLECPRACRSLLFTNPTAGSGPRRTLSTTSLLHSIIALILKQMNQISQSHNLLILELAFDILIHCCDLLECRVGISKSHLFQAIMKLNPVVTKQQRPWNKVEVLWIEFLKAYTNYPEGQTAVIKNIDILEVLMAITKSNKLFNRQEALLVLRNVSFYQPNRTKLLSSGAFLNILQTKLTNGTCDEKRIILKIMWTLASNCQKAKIIFKSACLDVKLENLIKCTELIQISSKAMEKEDLEMMYVVLRVLRGRDKIRRKRNK